MANPRGLFNMEFTKYFPNLNSVEEIINLPILHDYIDIIIQQGKISDIIKEIAIQSQLEFNLNS